MPTTHQNWNRPSIGDTGADYAAKISAIFEDLDPKVVMRGTSAERVAYDEPEVDMLWLETDDLNTAPWWYYDGTTWIELGGVTYTDEQAQDAVGLNLTNGLAYDDLAPSFGMNVVASGQVTLAGGEATIGTGIADVDATFMLSLGVDDPNADTELAGRLFWDDTAGTYQIRIVEQVTTVGNPTANYDIVRVR